MSPARRAGARASWAIRNNLPFVLPILDMSPPGLSDSQFLCYLEQESAETEVSVTSACGSAKLLADALAQV